MKRILSRHSRGAILELASSRSLLAFDYDGTLAPIVDDPSAAQMRDETNEWLERLCEVYPVAVISGRSRDDVGSRLGSARVQWVVGNHGLEPGGALAHHAAEVRRVIPALVRALRGAAGVVVEDKRYSITVHYRGADDKRAARAAILRAARDLGSDMRVIPGKQVISLVPAEGRTKGDALEEARAHFGATMALYVGDDVTDEDVFALDQPGRLLGVRVGRSRRSRAEYFLDDQGEIDALLARLWDTRVGPGRGAEIPLKGLAW